jgi:hypothetical protein
VEKVGKHGRIKIMQKINEKKNWRKKHVEENKGDGTKKGRGERIRSDIKEDRDRK